MIRISLFKIYLKGRVLLTFKDLIFILTWLFFLVCIADAMNGQPRGMTILLTIWWIFGFIYAWKIVDNYNLQKKEGTESEVKLENQTKTVKSLKPKFFEA